MSDTVDEKLVTLHTAAIDARNGYREAVKDADGKGLAPVFEELVAVHDRHATELARLLTERGKTPSDDGSFMSLVHKTVMDVRSLFGGLDESVIPGLIDGEKRNVETYDDVLKEPVATSVEGLLQRQRADLAGWIARLEAMKPR